MSASAREPGLLHLMEFLGDTDPPAEEDPTVNTGHAATAAKEAPDLRKPLPVMLALTGAAFTAELVYLGEAAGDVRQRIAERLAKRPLQLVLLQNNTSGARNLENHEFLVDDTVQILLRDFPIVTLRHKENKPEVYFAASIENANANEFMNYIQTPHPVQLLERDPLGPGGWAFIRIEGNTEKGLPEEVYVRQAHIVDLAETHIEPHRAPVENVPDDSVLVKVSHCDNRPDVVFHKDEQAAKARGPPHGYIPSGATTVSVSAHQNLNEKAGWCSVQWQGDTVWVRRAHIQGTPPGESMHDGTVQICHIEGRGDVVYHNTMEAAQSKGAPHGKVPSGSLSTVLQWDALRGARGWAKLTWRGGEIFVKQAHVRINRDETLEAAS